MHACSYGGGLIQRHNMTNEIIFSLWVDAGIPSRLEQTGELLGMQRADIISQPNLIGSPVIARTTVFDTTITKNGIEAADKRKIKKYQETCEAQGRDIFPLAFGIDGACLPTRDLLNKLISRLSADPEYGPLLQNLAP